MDLLFLKLDSLDGKSLADSLKKKNIFEGMSGYGRNIPVFRMINPSRITCVDINQLAVDKLCDDFWNERGWIVGYRSDILTWIVKDF